jgi:hypothetical protein
LLARPPSVPRNQIEYDNENPDIVQGYEKLDFEGFINII